MTKEERIELAKRSHNNVPVFSDYRNFLESKIEADVVAVNLMANAGYNPLALIVLKKENLMAVI